MGSRLGLEDIFVKKTPGIFRFATLPLEISEKKGFIPGNSAKLWYTYSLAWKFQGRKPRPIEILHDFSLIS